MDSTKGWLARNWKQGIHPVEAAITIGLWGGAVTAGADMTLVLPLLFAGFIVSAFGVGTYAEWHKPARCAAIFLLAIFFILTSLYLRVTHPATGEVPSKEFAAVANFFRQIWILPTVAGLLGIGLGLGLARGMKIIKIKRNGPSVAATAPLGNDNGPLKWAGHLGHTYLNKGLTIYTKAVQIGVQNISAKEIILEDAYIISAKTGEKLPLLLGTKEAGWIPAASANAIPPGMSINFQAEFDSPDGIAAQDFFDEWKVIYVVVIHDNTEDRTTIDRSMVEALFKNFQPPQIGSSASPRTSSRHSKSQAPQIDIYFEKRAPYEVSDIVSGRVNSTISIGIKNSGGGTLSNCEVFVEKISPEPAHVRNYPFRLSGGGFFLRSDEPEKIIGVAVYWTHLKQYRFLEPNSRGFGEASNYVDADIPRTVILRVQASECRKNQMFKMWLDESETLRLAVVGDAP